MSNRKKTKRDPLEIIRQARLPESVVPVCVRGDLAAEVEELNRRLAELKERPTDRLVGNPEARRIAEQIEALRAEMAEATVKFRLRALPHREYAKLEAQHPPRKDDDRDTTVGFNLETFPEPLIRACLVEPQLDDDAWQHLIDSLTFHQWDALFTAALMLNRREVSIPFSLAASRILRDSGER